LLKINFKELKEIMTWQACEVIPDRLVALEPEHVAYLFAKFHLTGLAVTDGPRPAVLMTLVDDMTSTDSIMTPTDNAVGLTTLKRTVYTLPSMSVVNAIGCGDVVAAVTLAQCCGGLPLALAFQQGLAAGCAACLTENPAQYDPEQARSLVTAVHILEHIDELPTLHVHDDISRVPTGEN
jgi:sugar/nucleoside kinase (ribokinase family)